MPPEWHGLSRRPVRVVPDYRDYPDHLDAPDGSRVYENRFVIWGRMSWGRLREYEVYEDTQESAKLDAWLTEHRPELAVGW